MRYVTERTAVSTAELLRTVRMSSTDRELAIVRLRRAELIVEAVSRGFTELRAAVIFLRRGAAALTARFSPKFSNPAQDRFGAGGCG